MLSEKIFKENNINVILIIFIILVLSVVYKDKRRLRSINYMYLPLFFIGLSTLLFHYNQYLGLTFLFIYFISLTYGNIEGFLIKTDTTITDEDVAELDIAPITQDNRILDSTFEELKNYMESNEKINSGNLLVNRSSLYTFDENMKIYVSEDDAQHYLKNKVFPYPSIFLDKLRKLFEVELNLIIKKILVIHSNDLEEDERLNALKENNFDEYLKLFEKMTNEQLLTTSLNSIDNIDEGKIRAYYLEHARREAITIGREDDKEYLEELADKKETEFNSLIRTFSTNISIVIQQMPLRLLIVHPISSLVISLIGTNQYTHIFLKRILSIINVQPLIINNSILKCTKNPKTGESVLMAYTFNPKNFTNTYDNPKHKQYTGTYDLLSTSGYMQKRRIYDDEVPEILAQVPIQFEYLKEPCNICDTTAAYKCPYSINGKVSNLMQKFWQAGYGKDVSESDSNIMYSGETIQFDENLFNEENEENEENQDNDNIADIEEPIDELDEDGNKYSFSVF